jgi:hypothetical protein
MGTDPIFRATFAMKSRLAATAKSAMNPGVRKIFPGKWGTSPFFRKYFKWNAVSVGIESPAA